MKRAVVCVATTAHYQRGMARLQEALRVHGSGCEAWMWSKELPSWKPHEAVPYAFKAHALMHAAIDDSPTGPADLLLWADACILPIRDMEPLWKRIEEQGYWFCNNGYSNAEWTADSAYPDLFPGEWIHDVKGTQQKNRAIPHVVATTFGLNIRDPRGAAFLQEYFRLASTTRAFCGPWGNTAWTEKDGSKPYSDPRNSRYGLCGPADVRGHRHDQTAASVIAWRLGMELTDPPAPFAYAKFNAAGNFNPDDQDQSTILVAHGKY